MSLRTRLILPAILSSLAVLAGCGSGNSNPIVTPPPSGGFSNSILTGNYVFSVTGTASSSDFVTIMGTFTADGKGNITAGVLDQNSTASKGLILDTITSGTYTVGTDGRPTGSPNIPTGLITVQTQNSGPFAFDYVLTSSTHGLVTQFETFGSASGSLDLQANVTQADVSGRSYAFNLTGSSGLGSDVCGFSAVSGVPTPFATVGAFTLDANGNVVSGTQDFNNNCISSGSTNVAMTGGKIDLTTFPGTAALTTGTGTSAITYTFDVYPIDATHLKFIEIDAQPMLVGDAFTQSSSIPAGNNVFTMAGFDVASNVGGPFTAAGIFHFDSNGNILSDSVEDINDAGLPGQFGSVTGGSAITAISTPFTAGRTEITFVTGFVNGNDGIACSSNCIFAAYPSSGGLQMLEIDDGGMTNGIAYAQSASTFASGEGYGMNLGGVTPNSAEDDIAEFTNNNGAFTGIIDVNDQGNTSFKNSFSANYAADTAVSGRGTVTPTKNGYLLTTYVVDSSTAVAVSIDPNFVALGALVKQNSSAKSNVVANHLAVLRVNASAHMMKSATKKTLPTRSTKKASTTRRPK
ncbi:MAG TPA: hypothetical protein VJP02_15065 [Candidatus Sulfotelmatobacter sp.]|nr:hypothetical protein [Candidatus Sulfotelmatobacter sp.]